MKIKLDNQTIENKVVQEISKENKIAKDMTVITIIGNVFLSFFKLGAGVFGHSGAMVSDSIHSFSDVFVTLIAYFGAKEASKEADKDHPYGHERIECVASLILGIVLILVGIMIGNDGLKHIFKDTSHIICPDKIALIAAIISITAKEMMYQYTMHYAKIINSNVFMADAWHHRSDGFSSIGALIGIIGAQLGYPVMDSVASVVICIFILKIGFDIVKDSIKKMLDTSCDDDYIENLKNYIASQKGVIAVDMIQSRLFGSKVYIDLEIKADGSMPLREAHQIAEDVHNSVEQRYPEIKHIMIHINPND